MREIPSKNYVIFAFVIIISIGIVAYCMRWYQMRTAIDKPQVMDGLVSEIKSEEIADYLLDNPNVIVYIAPSNQKSNQALEQELHDFIIKKELTNEFVYIDSRKMTTETYQQLEEQYLNDTLKNQSIDLSVTPNLWYFHEGKILDVMNTVSRKSSIHDVEYFLEKNGVY